jgi:tRNA A-37 threonylcarbamoyl transferase component Bud32
MKDVLFALTAFGPNDTVSSRYNGHDRGGQAPAEDRESLPMETPSDPIVTALDNAPAKMLGHYQLLRMLGKGGQASTYLARDTSLQRVVVLKRYHSSRTPDGREAVLSEGRSLVRVRSPYVAPCHGVEFEGDETILVVEHIPGRTLAKLDAADRLQFTRSAFLIEQIAEGLAEVHACGLLHRDIKPENIILGDDGRPRLVDFGLAAPFASASLQSISGSPPYMAPEQALGKGERIDGRTDIFGLGAVLYFLLTGGPPHQGKTRGEVLASAVECRPERPRAKEPRVPRSLERICLKAMQADPFNRYASAIEFKRALQRLRRRRGRHVPIAVAALAVALAGACALWIWHGFSNPRSSTADAEAVPGPAARPSGPAEPKVVRLSIHRRPKRDENRDAAEGQGVLGEQTFTARLDDQLTIDAELSEPAYGFLIALQADGVVAVCDPKEDATAPVLSRSLGYPGPSNPDEIYGLTEGTGLQAFAVVVSHQPLPSFREWTRRHGRPPWRAGLPGDPGVVWVDDGQWPLPLTADDPKGLRGKGVKVRGGGAAVGELRKWLSSVPGVDAVAVEAFSVEPGAMP